MEKKEKKEREKEKEEEVQEKRLSRSRRRRRRSRTLAIGPANPSSGGNTSTLHTGSAGTEISPAAAGPHLAIWLNVHLQRADRRSLPGIV